MKGAFLYDSVGFAAANCVWGLLAAGLVAPVLHLPGPTPEDACKLLEAGFFLYRVSHLLS